MNVRGLAALIGDASDAWVNDNVPSMSASLAFYTVLSIVPFLIVVTSAAAHFFGAQAVEGQLMWEIQDLTGIAGAEAIQALLKSAYNSSAAATVVGFVTLLFSASAVVIELRDSQNAIWQVPATATTFVRLVRERFYLFGLILGVGVLLAISLVVSTLVGVKPPRNVPPVLVHLAVFVGSFFLITALFAAIYKVVPDVHLDWTDVIVGASFTSFLFSVGKQLIGFYLGRVNYGSTYGAAGSVLIVLVWVYYSAQLFFFGAEFTRVYRQRR